MRFLFHVVSVAWVAICFLESDFHTGVDRAGPLHPGPALIPPVLPALGRPHFSWNIWLTLCPNTQADVFGCFFFSFKCNSQESFIHLNKLSIGHFYNKDTKAESAKICHRAKYVTGRTELFPSISSSLLSLFCLFFGSCNSKPSLFQINHSRKC